ncbi:uncharacterized protein LOC111705456 isoform X2 [Eurytemora carolleeae]|uniref:uncharacterized protein LOC111705456 isoform X2 n=1 Tax=Eurytemora carolleeae TaxID=1294199 RepID=UPI000C794C08|nr:uncharacterized protein LOC111705456 isoform X2 [Eurytemora carolleeae]|eukprot:XP_023333779.1 uncharacterized protein LOC111705456 isoform X2 [Eurytemora affinis]
MFSSIEGVLGGQENIKFWSVLDQTKGKVGFLNHHFIGTNLKYKKVILIGLDQTFSHYHAVALKLGHNLTKQREEKKLRFFNGARHILLNTIGQESMLRPENGLKELYKEISDLLEPDSFLILDNISVLTSLGFSNREVYLFLTKLSKLVDGLNSSMLSTFAQLEPDLLTYNISRNSDIHFEIQETALTGFKNWKI